MKIDYKITTIVLAGLLLVTYAWNWNAIFPNNQRGMMNTGNMSTGMKGMHMMPNGQMMMNNGGDMMDMTMNDMVGMMYGKTGKALEREFIMGMIPHHEGAVAMARVLLKDDTVSQELKDFANQIIEAQEGEIRMMKGWLRGY